MILNTKFIECNLKYDIDTPSLYDSYKIYDKIDSLNSKINRHQRKKYSRLIKKYKLLKYAKTFLKLNKQTCRLWKCYLWSSSS